MYIYKQEKEDGLLDKLKDSALSSIAHIEGKLELVEKKNNKAFASIESIATNLNQPDLYYLRTILVTTGTNKNDDIFLPEEVWKGRSTAEDKPFNLGHDPNKIIGHITGNQVVDDEYVLIDDDTAVDDLPEKFHILTSAVIYKQIQSRDPDLQDEIAELIEGIQDGEWYVSMECLFPSFAYGFLKADGSLEEIIERNKSTSYLTKYLKIYGGAGEYEGRKLGRVLKGIIFSGKGLVKKPANPESVILTTASKICVYNCRKDDIKQTEAIMADDIKVVELEKKNSELQNQIAALELKLKEGDVASYKGQIESLTASVNEKDQSIKSLSDEVATLKSDKETSAKELASVKADLEVKVQEINQTKADVLRTSRISSLVDKGVDKADAEKLVDRFVALSDEQFTDIVAMQESLVAAKKDKEKMKNEKTPKEGCAEDEANANTQVLDNAQPVPTIDTSVASDNTNTELQVALAGYLEDLLTK